MHINWHWKVLGATVSTVLIGWMFAPSHFSVSALEDQFAICKMWNESEVEVEKECWESSTINRSYVTGDVPPCAVDSRDGCNKTGEVEVFYLDEELMACIGWFPDCDTYADLKKNGSIPQLERFKCLTECKQRRKCVVGAPIANEKCFRYLVENETIPHCSGGQEKETWYYNRAWRKCDKACPILEQDFLFASEQECKDACTKKDFSKPGFEHCK